MAAGEQLIKHVYDAVRKPKYWDNAQADIGILKEITLIVLV